MLKEPSPNPPKCNTARGNKPWDLALPPVAKWKGDVLTLQDHESSLSDMTASNNRSIRIDGGWPTRRGDLETY